MQACSAYVYLKKYSKKLRKHLWRGLFCERCGITYHRLFNMKQNKSPLLQILRRCYLQHDNVKKLSL